MKKKSLRFKIIAVSASVAAVLILAVGIIFAVINSDDNFIDLSCPKITLNTEKQIGETLEFSLNTGTAYIDWGDGLPVKCDGGKMPYKYAYYGSPGTFYSGELKGNTVKIYSVKNITHFICRFI